MSKTKISLLVGSSSIKAIKRLIKSYQIEDVELVDDSNSADLIVTDEIEKINLGFINRKKHLLIAYDEPRKFIPENVIVKLAPEELLNNELFELITNLKLKEEK